MIVREVIRNLIEYPMDAQVAICGQVTIDTYDDDGSEVSVSEKFEFSIDEIDTSAGVVCIKGS